MLGITATAVIVLAAVRLLLLVRADSVGRHWLHVAGAAAAFATYLGLTYRVATTPVIGANIGGGALILGIVPAGLGALAWTAVALSNGPRANPRRRRFPHEGCATAPTGGRSLPGLRTPRPQRHGGAPPAG